MFCRILRGFCLILRAFCVFVVSSRYFVVSLGCVAFLSNPEGDLCFVVSLGCFAFNRIPCFFVVSLGCLRFVVSLGRLVVSYGFFFFWYTPRDRKKRKTPLKYDKKHLKDTIKTQIPLGIRQTTLRIRQNA